MNEKISIQNLVKNFDDKEVLCGIDLQVNKGESLVVLGGSGSGKSVLIKIIATLIAPTSGSIKIDGEEVSNDDWRQTDPLNPYDDLDNGEPASDDSTPMSDSSDDSEENLTNQEDETFWTWGTVLGVVGVALSVVGCFLGGTAALVVGVCAVAVGMIWLMWEIVDYNTPGPDANDAPFPQWPPV
jgi:energy-coupling factor transporter ATP-binding protein EcfA2